MKENKFFPAVATFVGTIIGAGFLGIPYVVSQSGFIPGMIYLFLIALFMLAVKLYLGEVILRTNGNHQLTGYAGKYLGKWGEIAMFFAMIFGLYSALLAYLIGEGKSLSFLFYGNFNYSFLFSILFWLLLSYLTFIGLKALKKYEKISMLLVLALFLIITFSYAREIRFENLSYITKSELFLPFGVILFSFLGFSAMPEVKRILKGQEKLMKRVILISFLIPFVVYLFFTLVTVGVFGADVQEIATLSLGRFASLLGVITMFTAYFVLSLCMRDMFRFDFNFGRFKGWLLSDLIPIILFLIVVFFKIDSFTEILGIAGVVSGGITGILVLFMNYQSKKKGKRKPEYSIKINKWIILILSLIFILGVILELIVSLKLL